MEGIDYKTQSKSPVIKYIYYSIIALIFIIIHLTLLNLISFYELAPDLLLILCVWIAINEGQFKAMFIGFAIGFIFDLVSFDVVGTNALSKTIVCFIAGFYYKEGKEMQIIGSYKFLMIILLSSIVNNILYTIFYIKPSDIGFFSFFFRYGFLSAIYTTCISLAIVAWKMPRKRI